MSNLLRIVRQVVRRVARYLIPTAGALTVGAASGAPITASPGYPVMNSMSAVAAFPWVWVGCMAPVNDLCSLPLVAVRTTRDASGKERREIVDGHPGLRALQNPSPGITETRLRRQLVLDLRLTGNAYLWRASPVLLYRLHPNLMEPIVDPGLGQVAGYKYQGTRHIPASDLMHMADVSWQDDVQAAFGESPIRALHHGLEVAQSTREHSAKAAKRGRAEWLVSPKGDDSILGDKALRTIVERIEASQHRGESVVSFGQALNAKQLSLSPRDLEFVKLHELTREEILAVFGVPPVRAGLSTANYGTAKTQMRMYWEQLRSWAKLIDDELSKLTGDPNVRIEHDFSMVEALQVSYTERLARVANWVNLGASPAAAARYEGFTEAPVPDVLPVEFTNPRRPRTEVEEPQKGLEVALVAYLSQAAARYQAWISGGADLGLCERVEAGMLRGTLERCGASAELATWLGVEVAALNHEVVRQVADRAALDESDVPNLSELPAFIAARAATIARAARNGARAEAA